MSALRTSIGGGPAQSSANFLGNSEGTTIEYDVWENQRLSKDNVFSQESRVTGDRPPWSTKDGKRAQHRDAFLLPDLSWRWEGTWYIADIDGRAVDPWEAQNGSAGWLYAPSYLVSTKQCSTKQNALSLVRRRRWMRRAVKISDDDAGGGGASAALPLTVQMTDTLLFTGEDDAATAEVKAAEAFSQKLLEILPHPVFVAHYGYASAPELVAASANSPMLNKEVAAAAAPSASLASRAFSALKSFNPFGSKESSSSAPSSNAGSGITAPAAAAASPVTPQGGTTPTFANNGDNSNNNSTRASGGVGAPGQLRSLAVGVTVMPSALAEVALLLKHHQTFDTLQAYMAEVLAAASPSRQRSGGGGDSFSGPPSPASAASAASGSGVDGAFTSKISALPPNIQQILRESGVPQALRAPMWLGFSGALRLKMKNPGKYRALLERVRAQKRILNRNDPINLDVKRSCSTHPYFAGGKGPGATALRNILFAFELMGLDEHEEQERKRREVEAALERGKARATDQIMDELFVGSVVAAAAAVVPASDDNKTNNSNSNTAAAAEAAAAAAAPVMDVRNLPLDESASPAAAQQKKKRHDIDHPTPQVYHQPLSYVASIFLMNCQNEEDAFWLLAVMAEQCPLMQSSPEGHRMMDECVQNFGKELVRRASVNGGAEGGNGNNNNNGASSLQQLLAQVDLSISAYGWFQALLCAHVSCPVASRLFDIFLVNVRDINAFVDFAVTLVLKCLSDTAALAAFCASETGGGGRIDQVAVMKFLNEQMRRVSCDITL